MYVQINYVSYFEQFNLFLCIFEMYLYLEKMIKNDHTQFQIVHQISVVSLFYST